LPNLGIEANAYYVKRLHTLLRAILSFLLLGNSRVSREEGRQVGVGLKKDRGGEVY